MMGVEISQETKAELARTLKESYILENQYTNYRMSWLGTFQGLLFTALAFSFQGAPLWVAAVISVVGISIAVSIGSLLQTGNRALQALREKFFALNLDKAKYPPLLYIGYVNNKWEYPDILYPDKLIPTALTVAWTIILVYCIVSLLR